MKNVINVAVYGFTEHQSVLLSPFIRKIWNVAKITVLNSESDLKKNFCNASLLVVNGCLDFFELEFILSLAQGEKELQLACIAFEPLTQAGYESICRHEVPVVISGFCTENDISLCRERIEKFGSYKVSYTAPDVVESSCREDFEKLSPNEKSVMVFMLRGMKQEAIARKLGISASTVGTYFSRIYKKCDVSSRNELYQKFAL